MKEREYYKIKKYDMADRPLTTIGPFKELDEANKVLEFLKTQEQYGHFHILVTIREEVAETMEEYEQLLNQGFINSEEFLEKQTNREKDEGKTL